MDEISELVASYNAAEREQEIRLNRLYVLMAARQGYRFIRFGDNGRLWCNEWSMADRALNGLISFITEVNQGGE
jgi:hypothetical protein